MGSPAGSSSSPLSEVFTYSNLVHAVSGSCGGMTAITVFYPLNTVRTHLQVSDSAHFSGIWEGTLDLFRTGGLAALYQGWTAQVVSLGSSNFVYFYAYNMLKAVYLAHLRKIGQKPVVTPGVGLAMASVAGVVNVLTTTPLWVVSTRLTLQHSRSKKKAAAAAAKPSAKPVTPGAAQPAAAAAEAEPEPYSGMFDALVRMWREEGPGSLWNGVGPSLVLVSNPTIQFVVYEIVRRWASKLAKRRGSGITPFEFFVLGSVAKAVATVLTYPLQVAQSRLRASHVASSSSLKQHPGVVSPSSTHAYTGTVDCLRQLYRADGVAGWFRGMSAKLWQTVLTAGFQFLCYEQIQAAVESALLRRSAAQAAEAVKAAAASAK